MMKVHVCPGCKYRVLTSRRKECICKNCERPMYRVDTIGFEDWWQMEEDQRNTVIEEFLANKNPA
ncbi:MAG: hypothetical protein J6B39_05330 [Lachnospiraceae bacterium]|nr:hypothetical protein [Lachnospiraceae bacterium]